MSVYKFNVRLFDSFTGEILGEFVTNPLGFPDEQEKLINYMRAYCRKLNNQPNVEFGMTVTCEKLINKRHPIRQDDRYIEGQFF